MRLGDWAYDALLVSVTAVAGVLIRRVLSVLFSSAVWGVLDEGALLVSDSAANAIGCALAGAVYAVRHHMPRWLVTVLSTGLCGCITTFSAWQVELVALSGFARGSAARVLAGELVQLAVVFASFSLGEHAGVAGHALALRARRASCTRRAHYHDHEDDAHDAHDGDGHAASHAATVSLSADVPSVAIVQPAAPDAGTACGDVAAAVADAPGANLRHAIAPPPLDSGVAVAVAGGVGSAPDALPQAPSPPPSPPPLDAPSHSPLPGAKPELSVPAPVSAPEHVPACVYVILLACSVAAHVMLGVGAFVLADDAAPLHGATLLAAMFFGPLGAVTRFTVTALLNRPAFPAGTLVVNVAAAAVSAVIFMLATGATAAGGEGVALRGVSLGMCSSLSTASSFVADCRALARAERTPTAYVYALATVAGGLAVVSLVLGVGGAAGR